MTKTLARWLAFVLASAPAFVLACEGEQAMARIERSETIGWALLGVSCVVGLLAQRLVLRARAQRWAPIVLGALVLTHPGWWMSARSGDCGQERLWTSISATVALAVVAAILLARALRSGERFTKG